MTFFLIGLGGFIWALLTNLAGADHDGGAGGDHDFSADHEVGHDVGHDGDAHEDIGPSPFSLRTFSIFTMFFGFGGAVAQYYGASWGWASGAGFGAGFVAAFIGFQFIKLLYGQQADSTINIAELVGRSAEVINAIPQDGVGEITIVHRGQRKDLLARSKEGSIPLGAKVRIIDDFGSSVLVSGQTE